MRGDTSRTDDYGAIILRDNERITTAMQYAPPISFTIVARTDSTNLRLAYACDQMIFNWEVDPNQFRIDGGAADKRNKKGVGTIPTNQWVTVQITVLPNCMRVSVDGQERYETYADFSSVNQALSIFPANGSPVEVKSVKARVAG
jgi:hypothetical protein